MDNFNDSLNSNINIFNNTLIQRAFMQALSQTIFKDINVNTQLNHFNENTIREKPVNETLIKSASLIPEYKEDIQIVLKSRSSSVEKEKSSKQIGLVKEKVETNANDDYDENEKTDIKIFYFDNDEIKIHFIKDGKKNFKQYLRCRDFKRCKGRGMLNSSEEIIITHPCTISTDEHFYNKEINFFEKISKGEINAEDLSNEMNQRIYFKYQILTDPTQSNHLLFSNFFQKYRVASKLSSRDLSLIKTRIKAMNIENLSKEIMLDEIKYYDDNLLQIKHTFKNSKNVYITLRIFCSQHMLLSFRDKNIIQHYIDSTYKYKPTMTNIKCTNICIGYNQLTCKHDIIYIALLQNEEEKTFFQLYSLLKFRFAFNPTLVTCDFMISNISALSKCYDKLNFNLCFFHLIQALWRKLSSLGLRKQQYIKTSKILIFNLKVLCFTNPEYIDKQFNVICEYFKDKDPKYMEFLDYYRNCWIKGKYKIDHWNYYNNISQKKVKKKTIVTIKDNISFTNNSIESLNGYVNSLLPRRTNTLDITEFEKITCSLILKYEGPLKRKISQIDNNDFKLSPTKVTDLIFFIINNLITDDYQFIDNECLNQYVETFNEVFLL
jgi:hypothetical protein